MNKYNAVYVLKNQKTFCILQLRVMYIYAYSLGNKYQIIQNSCATDLKAHLIHVMRVTLFSIATQRRRRHHSVCMHNLLFSRKNLSTGRRNRLVNDNYWVRIYLNILFTTQRSKWIWNGICKCPGLFELFLTNSTFIGHLHMSILIFSPTFNICWKLTIFFCRETFPYDNFNWFMYIKCPKWHPL